MGPTLALHSVCLLTVVPKCSYMGIDFKYELHSWGTDSSLLTLPPHTHIFSLPEDKHCCCWGWMAGFFWGESRRGSGRKPELTGEWGEWWVTILNLDAVFWGAVEVWEGIHRKPLKLGEDWAVRGSPPWPLRLGRAVFVLSASLQCCLVAFRSSSIVQGYERTKNGLPQGQRSRIQLVQLYGLSLFIHFGLKLFFK